MARGALLGLGKSPGTAVALGQRWGLSRVALAFRKSGSTIGNPQLFLSPEFVCNGITL